MYLFELFSDDEDDNGNVMNGFRQQVMDLLTPLAANGVPFVTLQQLIDKMGEQRSGISIDRNLLFTLLDPDQIALIKSVEGDRVYLQLPTSENSDKENKKKEDLEKQEKQFHKDAEKNAQKQLSQEQKPTATPPADDTPLGKL